MLSRCLLIAFVTVLVASCKKETPSDNGLPALFSINESYGSDPMQKMDMYLPAGRTTVSTKVMILVHGGAWAAGDKTDFASFIDSLKKRLPDYALFNINYRLSAPPLNPFPTQEQDIKSAVEFIYNKRSEYQVSDRFVMTGASAGAHLSLLHAYKYNTPVKIKAVVDFFGPTDMTELYNNPGMVPQASIAAIVGATPLTNPVLYYQSSPVNYVTNSSACPTIILQGSADPLVNAVSQSQALRNKLQAQSVPVQYAEYAGKGHGDDWDSNIYFDAFNKIQAFLAVHNP